MIRSRSLIYCLALIFIVFLSNVSVFADNKPDESEDVLTRDAIEYVKSFGVSLETAKKRLSLQILIGEFQEKLKQLKGRQFAGLYIQHQPEYQVNVLYKAGRRNFPKKVKKILKKNKWKELADVVELKQVKNTLEELIQLQTDANKVADKAGMPFDSDINIKDGFVYVGTTDADKFNAELEAQGLTLPVGVTLLEIEQLSHADVSDTTEIKDK